jgi:hypothetical protein
MKWGKARTSCGGTQKPQSVLEAVSYGTQNV